MDEQRKRLRESIALKGRFSKPGPRPKKKPKPKKEKIMADSDKLIVVARNPAEMQIAQQKLCAWAERKVSECELEMTEAETNLEQAKKSKWRQTGFKTHIRHARERLTYYTKVKAALEAGYVIVPNFDLDIFAIRTTRKKPKDEVGSNTWQKPTPDMFENESNRPALGEGEYHDAWPVLRHEVVEHENSKGEMIKYNEAFPIQWQEPDFPYKIAKPQILSDTSIAMARMIFDEIGVSPHRRVRKQDPMIVGQIVYKKSKYQVKRLSFLLAWWIDETDLEI